MSKKGDLVMFFAKSASDQVRFMDDGTPFKTYLALETVDCAKGMMGVVANDIYDADGELVYAWKEAPGQFKFSIDAKPGSIAETMARQVCKPNAAVMAEDGAQENEGSVSSGTAWMGPKGYLITANHVVAGADTLELAQNGVSVGTADVIVTDPANDIAVLRPHLNGAAHKAISLRPSSARLGEKTFTLGYPAPDALGWSIKMTSGEVSAMSGNASESAGTAGTDDPRMLQISAPVQSGNSGGPLLDASGRAVGIILAKQEKISETEVAQNVNYALKIGYLQNLLAELPDIGGYIQPAPTTVLVETVAELKDSVFLLLAATKAQSDR
jgi:S1-C subfamily serine protease